MLSKSLAVLASAALAAAGPISRRQEDGPSCGGSRPSPILPVNGGERELEGPPAGSTLKYIVLGHGIQNYTCSEAGAEPKATGALAVLYDITSLYPGQGASSLTLDAFDQLASDALWDTEVPLNMANPPSETAIAPGADLQAPFPAEAPLQLEGMEPIPFAGHHFFNGEGVPQFRVGDIDFLATKIDSIDAPSTADAGPDDTGAVGWLHLGAGEGTVGAELVYRVITAGGNSHGCTAAGEDSTSYATQYWFYA